MRILVLMILATCAAPARADFVSGMATTMQQRTRTVSMADALELRILDLKDALARQRVEIELLRARHTLIVDQVRRIELLGRRGWSAADLASADAGR